MTTLLLPNKTDAWAEVRLSGGMRTFIRGQPWARVAGWHLELVHDDYVPAADWSRAPSTRLWLADTVTRSLTQTRGILCETTIKTAPITQPLASALGWYQPLTSYHPGCPWLPLKHLPVKPTTEISTVVNIHYSTKLLVAVCILYVNVLN